MFNDVVLWFGVWWRVTTILSEFDEKDLTEPDAFYGLRYTTSLLQWEAYFMMLNGFFMFVMMFKHMTFSSKLRFIFDLFDKTASDLIYFSIVFLIFLLAFSMSGFIVFGSDVRMFRSLTQSFLNLLIASVNDLDFDDIYKSNRSLAIVYSFLWVFIMLMILINVFIAILLDAYTDLREEKDEEAKRGDGQEEGFTQITKQFTRYVKQASKKFGTLKRSLTFASPGHQPLNDG